MFSELIFRPLYNILIGLMDILPWADVGVAVIIFTILLKVALFPLSKAAMLAQVRMKEIEPEAAKIRSQYASDKNLQAQKMMQLYKARNIKPFASILPLIIQAVILIYLFYVFYEIIPTINTGLLYSFVSVPTLKTNFLGIVDLTKPNVYLALLTAVIQFFQLKFSLASQPPVPQQANKNDPQAAMAQMMGSMGSQMKYVVPVILFISLNWGIPARYPEAASIIAIYWMTSAFMTFLQELVIRKKYVKAKIA